MYHTQVRRPRAGELLEVRVPEGHECVVASEGLTYITFGSGGLGVDVRQETERCGLLAGLLRFC